MKTEKTATAPSLIKDLERLKVEAGELAGDLTAHLTDLATARTAAIDGAEQDVAAHKERLDVLARESEADKRRLQADIHAKIAKIKDIQSRFGAVLGTVNQPLPD